MEIVKRIITSPAIIKTAAMLAAVLVLMALSQLFVSRYNKGYSHAFLYISRACIVAACVLVVVWIIGGF